MSPTGMLSGRRDSMEIQLVDPNMNRRGSYTNITQVQPQFVHTQPQQLQPVQVVTLAAPPPPVSHFPQMCCPGASPIVNVCDCRIARAHAHT